MHIDQIHAQTVPAKALEARKVFLSGPVGCGKTTDAAKVAIASSTLWFYRRD